MALRFTKTQPAARPPVSANPRESIDDYLGRLGNALPAGFSPAHRVRIIHESRSHLEAMVEARQELGETEEEAVAGALSEFGAAPAVAAAWRSAANVPTVVKGGLAGAVTLALFVYCLGAFSWLAVELARMTAIAPINGIVAGPWIPLVLGAWWGLRHSSTRRGYRYFFASCGISLLLSLIAPGPAGFGGALDLERGFVLQPEGVRLIWGACQLSMWVIVTMASAGACAVGRRLLDDWRAKRMKVA